MGASPVVARWELSSRLSSRRKELGLDVKTITSALGFTRNYWSAVENDRTLIAEDKLRQLFDVLSFDADDQRELLELRQASRVRGWWDRFPGINTERRRFIGLEHGAASMRIYEGHLIPGLLQTDDYTRALLGTDPSVSPVDLEDIINLRKRRQERLDEVPRPHLVAIIGEAALRQQVAGPELQARQIRHILDFAAARPAQVEVRVLAFASNPGILISSSTLLLLEFNSEHLPNMAWQEAVRPVGYLEGHDDHYRWLDLAWEDGQKRALSAADSERLMRELIVEFS